LLVELYIQEPLFCGKTEPDQINRIFEICGTPEKNDWKPQSTFYKDMKPKEPKERQLLQHVRSKAKYSRLTTHALDLIDKLLTLNPEKRLSADEALDHDYFLESPRIDKADLPKYIGQSHNELSSKRSRELQYRPGPPHKRFRPNDTRPPHYRDDRPRYQQHQRGNRNDYEPNYHHRRSYGNRNPEYAPPRNNFNRHPPRHTNHPPRNGNGSHTRRYPSDEREPRLPPQSRREPAAPTHTEPPRDYREVKLSPTKSQKN